MLTGGIEPRAGKLYRSTDFEGNVILFFPSCIAHSTLDGAVSRSAMFGVPRMWHAMSPIAPQPYSGNPRHFFGTYAGLYGRIGDPASHAFQSSVSGTASSFTATSGPCTQYLPGRSVHA